MMIDSSSLTLALLIVAPVVLLTVANAQIPTACADQNSLENSICCPITADGVCGVSTNRGLCVTLNFAGYDMAAKQVMCVTHYYTQICRCNGNFGGYNCSRCEFGYYGSDCSEFQVLPRPPARDLSDADWADFVSIMKMPKTYDSDYHAVLEESKPGNASIPTASLTIFNYYAWIHHYTP